MEIKKILLNIKRNRKTNLLGIDIRQNFIRLVELSFNGTKYRIEACVNWILTEAESSDELIVAAIKKMLQQVGSKTKFVAMALPHSVVFFKEEQVACDLSSEEMAEFLRFNFVEEMGGDKADISFDYQTSGTVTIDGLVKLQSVAVRREHSDKWLALLQATALCPKIIDVDMYALERAVRFQLKNILELTAVINIDYGQVLIVVLDSEKIVYMHEEVVGKENLVAVNQLLEFLDLKLHLINSALLQPIRQIILGGEITALSGLVSAMSSKFKIQIILANPFLDMEMSTVLAPECVSELSPLMLISCGLALRVRDDNKN